MEVKVKRIKLYIPGWFCRADAHNHLGRDCTRQCIWCQRYQAGLIVHGVVGRQLSPYTGRELLHYGLNHPAHWNDRDIARAWWYRNCVDNQAHYDRNLRQAMALLDASTRWFRDSGSSTLTDTAIRTALNTMYSRHQGTVPRRLAGRRVLPRLWSELRKLILGD
jgi:hypothetical protein